MKILISNDDGIHAPGLHILAERLAEDHEVYVVAPDTEKSASSASITLRLPLRVKEYRPHFKTKVKKYFHVNGMPADCVKMALRVILSDGMPDVVISGINHGGNMGVDIRYSGTVAAAFEGLFFGLPSIAVSSATFGPDPRYDTAAEFIAGHLDGLRARCLEFGCRFVLNVNVPSKPASEVHGYRMTRINNFRYNDSYKEIADPMQFAHYWLSGSIVSVEDDGHTDYAAVREGFVSVTPLQLDPTDHEALKNIKEL